MNVFHKLYSKNVGNIQVDGDGFGTGDCPFCNGKSQLTASLNTGIFFCHNGCGMGTAVQFAKRLRVSFSPLQVKNIQSTDITDNYNRRII